MADRKMPLIEHLEELRNRLFVSLVCIAIGASISYYFWEFLLGILKAPIGSAKLVYLSPMEPFLARFKLAIWAGFFLAFPIILYEALAFVTPALKRREKRYIFITIIFLIPLFVGGVYFGYEYVFPIGLKWLMAQGGDVIQQNLTVSHYISFSGLFLLAFGASFETPLVIFLLVKLGVIPRRSLITNWRVALLIILIVAAVITPDWSPFTMSLMAIPMIGLYIFSIFLAYLF